METSPELTQDETDALDLLDSAAAAATAYGREDLIPGAESVRSLVTEPEFVVVVAGEFKTGKSTLVNALVDASICPVDDDIATAVPTSVRHGPETRASILTGDEVIAITMEEAADYIVETMDTSESPDLVEIMLPRRLLVDGLVMVDTPGVGGLDSNHGAATLGALAFADLVIFVTDASQELTAPEMEFLDHARRLCNSVMCVITKTDFYPHWRQIAELNRGHLDQAGITIPIFPVSSPVRLEALRLDDRELDHESGYDKLVQHLHLAESTRSASVIRSAGKYAAEVAAELAAPFESELAVLSNPGRKAELLNGLREARERAEKLRSDGARWQHQLSDGLGDLSSDVLFDLRTRMGAVLEEADKLIEDDDPASIWDELEALAEHAVREAIVANYEVLHARTEALTTTVNENFLAESTDITNLMSGNPSGLSDTELAGRAEGVSFGTVIGGALTGLRGSYSGMMMFNMLGGVLGLTVIAPVTIVLGVFMGGKAVKGERKRQLAAARQSARQSIRKFVEVASVDTNRGIQESLKRIQRTLRDHYSEKARRYQKTTADSLAAAQNALKSEAANAGRVADLEAEIQRLRLLRERAESLTTLGAPR